MVDPLQQSAGAERSMFCASDPSKKQISMFAFRYDFYGSRRAHSTAKALDTDVHHEVFFDVELK